MKAIQLQVFLPDETTDVERQAIIDAIFKSGAIDGMQTVVSGHASIVAQQRDWTKARAYEAIKRALTTPID